MVDWIRRPYTTKARIHDSPDAPIVDLVWYITDLPPVGDGQEYVINSRDWDSEPWAELAVGELPTDAVERKYNNRWNRPALAMGQHVCHPEWLADGEPWPTMLPDTEYLQDYIPKCCVQPMCCEIQECEKTTLNGDDAGNFQIYPIPAKDADGETPNFQIVVAKKGDSVVDDTPNFQMLWKPQGDDESPNFQIIRQWGPNPLFRWEEEQFQIVPGNTEFKRRRDSSGEQWEYKIDGVSFSLLFTMLSGQGVISGSNVRLDSSLVPPAAPEYTHAVIEATGTGPGDAALMTTQTAEILVTSANNAGVTLPNQSSGYGWCALLNESPTKTFRAYAIAGEGIAPPIGPPPTPFINLPPRTYNLFFRARSLMWFRVLSLSTL